MGWRNAEADPPQDQKLVLVVLVDGTKEILSWRGSLPWIDQHAVERPELQPYVWHDLPPPPPPPSSSLIFVSAPPKVHILRHGEPMCRFTTDLPKDWPKGVSWVSFEDLELLANVDCPDCQLDYGFPECSICQTTHHSSSPGRVERDSSGREMFRPCSRCGTMTPWMISGSTKRLWASPFSRST